MEENSNKPEISSTTVLPNKSKEENFSVAVPFLPETDDSTSSVISNENFDDVISPPTPPNLSLKEESTETKSLLKRPQISNGLSNSQVYDNNMNFYNCSVFSCNIGQVYWIIVLVLFLL